MSGGDAPGGEIVPESDTLTRTAIGAAFLLAAMLDTLHGETAATFALCADLGHVRPNADTPCTCTAVTAALALRAAGLD